MSNISSLAINLLIGVYSYLDKYVLYFYRLGPLSVLPRSLRGQTQWPMVVIILIIANCVQNVPGA